MSGYEADFITGRSINSKDRAVAIVIAPAVHGYPNPVKFAATAPVYPHDRFEPLSLPLNGSLDKNGFFKPDKDQTSLMIFESLVKMPWSQFRTNILNKEESTITLGRHELEKETLAPGLAIMHKSTADAFIGMAREDLDTQAAAEAATRITLDAKRRVVEGDHRYWNISSMKHPGTNTYTTLDNDVIPVPNVMHAMTDGEPRLLGRKAKSIVLRHHDEAGFDDGHKIKAIFECLIEFQKLSYGMRMIQRHLQPSNFARSDNLMAVTKFNLKVVDQAMEGLSKRDGFECDDDRWNDHLELVAESLRNTLEKVEAELAKRTSLTM